MATTRGIIGLACGRRGHALCGAAIPSKTDRKLIWTAYNRGLLEDKRLYSQEEQAVCLASLPERIRKNLRLTVKEHEEGPHVFLDSQSVIRQCLKKAAEDSVKELEILAMPVYHRTLCLMQARQEAKKYNIKISILPIGFQSKFLQNFDWMLWLLSFDLKSDHWQTRSPIHITLYVLIKHLKNLIKLPSGFIPKKS